MKPGIYNKISTIFQNEPVQINSFFKKTQIFKALQKPIDLNLLNFEQIAENEDFIPIFKKELLLNEFLLKQTLKNHSLANVFILIYSFLFFLNCACSTIYPYFSTDFSFDSLSSYFYLGVYVLLANIFFYLAFERYTYKAKKKDWWKVQNLRVFTFCLVMTIAQIKYLVDLDSNSLFKQYKFMYFWGYLQYPLILNMLLLLMQGFLIKVISIFISQTLLITFIMISENQLQKFERGFAITLSFSYLLFYFMYAYVEEIHLKEKYEFFLNFQKTSVDWQNIINNVPHGIALFRKDPERNLIFSNSYGNEALKVNISSPQRSCFETLSSNFGELQKITINNKGLSCKNTNRIASEQRIENTIKSIKKYESSIPEKGSIKDICAVLEESSFIFTDQWTVVYKTTEKIKIPDESKFDLCNEEKNFLIKFKIIDFENKPTFLLILEDNSQSELINTLKENNDYKSKLLSSFSHELRTPLNGAMPLLKNLYNDENFKRNDAEKHYQLCIAINSLLILQSVLNDIVDYAQINSNQLQLNCMEIDMKQIIMECLDVVSLQIKEKQIDLQVFINPDIPHRFCTDRNRVSQILLNLLRNAIKFSKNNGKIIFLAKNLEILANNLISFKLQDFGIGIPPYELEKLKDQLKNIKNEEMSSSNTQSSSLGLVISQNLALILGPSNDLSGININSEFEEGTTVEFLIEDKAGMSLAGGEYPSFSMVKSTLEKKCPENIKKGHFERKTFFKQSILWVEKNQVGKNQKIMEDNTEVNFEKNEKVQKVKIMDFFAGKLNFVEKFKKSNKFCCEPILVVDDDPFNLLSAEVIIKKLGYSLVKSFNGKEAIEVVEKKYANKKCNDDCKGFLLIIMDYNMPVMNGLEATRELKAKMRKKEIPDIPIIACTAFGAKDDIANCFEAGMNDYLAKPITLESLSIIFAKWIKVE